MNSKNYLKIELSKVFNKFSNITINYEFKSNRLSHIIEVKPLTIFESDSFISEEIRFSENFNQFFPNESLVFISENSLIKIENSTFKFEKSYISICFKNNYLITEPIFNNSNQTFEHSGIGNFALAA